MITRLAIYTPIILPGKTASKGAANSANPCAHFQQLNAPKKDKKSKLNNFVALTKLP